MEITGKSWKYRESCQNDSRILDETVMTRSLRGMNHWSMSEWHPKGPDVVLQASDGCHSAGFPPSTVCVSLITITASARGCGNSWGRRAMFQWVSSYSHPMKSLPLLQLRKPSELVQENPVRLPAPANHPDTVNVSGSTPALWWGGFGISHKYIHQW